ncbi:unnamed protein product [Bemisia tabaci]|uniref:Glycosyl hydrolase family 13 catalytic domain-containing protein n=1 Tax=Bemisia tabaci TaxID=7038 RepID=A0A9P0F189_BEMTA|nr:unnamed protein product [Bemisia tabaci]
MCSSIRAGVRDEPSVPSPDLSPSYLRGGYPSSISKLVAVFCLVMAATSCEVMKAYPQRDLAWWEWGVIYQIYPRSFKDSNGDGVGDLKGIAEKVNYLSNLGIKAVWLSPIFRSPMVDFGYDISDFRFIEPMFGTMEDFEVLKELFQKNGLKITLDFRRKRGSLHKLLRFG